MCKNSRIKESAIKVKFSFCNVPTYPSREQRNCIKRHLFGCTCRVNRTATKLLVTE